MLIFVDGLKMRVNMNQRQKLSIGMVILFLGTDAN